MKMHGLKTAKIKFLNVGHGDATLIQCISQGNDTWTCLIDGGQGHSLYHFIKELKLEKIDLLILSHLDYDHIDGFIKMLSRDDINIQIKRAWFPFLPAIKRFQWMFGARTKQCVQNGEDLLKLLEKRKVSVIYPLERYIETALDEAVSLEVISPAKRLIDILYRGDPGIERLVSIPLPINEIIENGYILEEYSQEMGMAELDPLNQGFITGRQFHIADFQKIDIPDDKRKIDCKHTSYEPDWYGDHLLNDTSIIVLVTIFVFGLPYRILFTGDQENWTYILSKPDSPSLVDILKMPHHGGRMYFLTDERPQEILRQLNPRYSVISASGQYRLPLKNTLDAGLVYSEHLFSTMTEMPAYLNAYKPIKRSIFRKKAKKKDHTELFDLSEEQGVELVITKDGMFHNKPPLHTNYISARPIVQFHTVIEKELLSGKKARTKRNLKEIINAFQNIHKRRYYRNGSSIRDCLDIKDTSYAPVDIECLRAQLSDDNVELHQTEILEALNEGLKYGEIVEIADEHRFRHQYSKWYLNPSQSHIQDFIRQLDSIDCIVLFNSKSINVDRFSLLLESDWTDILEFYCALSGFPKELVKSHIIPRAIPHFANRYNCYYSQFEIKDREAYKPQNKNIFTLFLLKKSESLEKMWCDLVTRIIDKEITSLKITRAFNNHSGFPMGIVLAKEIEYWDDNKCGLFTLLRISSDHVKIDDLKFSRLIVELLAPLRIGTGVLLEGIRDLEPLIGRGELKNEFIKFAKKYETEIQKFLQDYAEKNHLEMDKIDKVNWYLFMMDYRKSFFNMIEADDYAYHPDEFFMLIFKNWINYRQQFFTAIEEKHILEYYFDHLLDIRVQENPKIKNKILLDLTRLYLSQFVKQHH